MANSVASNATTDPVAPAAGHDHDAVIDPRPYRPSGARTIITIAIAVTILAVLVVVGVVPRLRASEQQRDDRERMDHELAKVTVTKPLQPKTGAKLTLPGEIQAVQEAIVYARTSGYIHSYAVDLGDKVKVGQVLATIDTPEVDQELRQAQSSADAAAATVEQAKTQAVLAGNESKRYQELVGQGVVSQQDSEEHTANAQAQSASLHSLQAAQASAAANVARLRDLKGFSVVTAPFEGTITSRTVEIGQLVAAGTGQGQALFKIANTSVMRVYVNVPQVYAPSLHIGDETTVTLREFPNRTFTGKITRTAGALDPATRTLLTEVRIQNDDGALLPGMYAQLALAVNRVDSPMLIPPTAVVNNASGTRVAIVDHGAIRWKEVKIDTDLGDQLAVLSGVSPTDDLVVAPSDRLVDGMQVTMQQAKPSTPAAGTATPPPPPAPVVPTNATATPASVPAIAPH